MKKIITLFCLFLLVLTTIASASKTTDELLCIDSSNIEYGTITVTILDPVELLRYKLKVAYGEKCYYYNLDPHRETVIPLQMGNGTYYVTLYEQIVDNKYTPVGEASLYLDIDRKNVWLESNSKVDYSSSEKIHAELEKVVSVANTETEKYEKITRYIRTWFIYDWSAASRKNAPEYTDIDRVLTRRIGLCEELSALTVAMLRLSDIQSRLVIGKANSATHAWVEALVDGKIRRFDPLASLFLWLTSTKYHAERYY